MISKLHSLIILMVLLFLTGSCYKEIIEPEDIKEDSPPAILAFDGVPVFEDLESYFLLYTLAEDSLASFNPLVEFDTLLQISLGGISLIPGEINTLGSVKINQAYPLVIKKGHKMDSFNLRFTTLPILRIITNDRIPNEPKLESWMQLSYQNPDSQYSSTLLFESHAGIEIRGISANRFDKRAFGIELWQNEFREDRSVPLLGMGYCEDWILDAMYIDELRMRNKLSFDLWNKMETRHTNDLMEEKRTGIKMEYVELFLNQRYHGLYCLGERMDEQVMDFTYSQDEKGGVMYKTYGWHEGSTTFRSYLNEPILAMEWDGWEQIYPENFFNWDPLAELRKMVALSEDEVFIEEIGSLLDLENTANFYVFLNLLMAWDNTGKNIFMARYSESTKFFFIPWDLEATWGRNWKMEDSGPYGSVQNGLHERLIDLNAAGYSDSVSSLWENYRSSIFQKEALMQMIDENYFLLKKNGVIQRENNRWGLDIDLDEEYKYLDDWIDKRLGDLDNRL